MEIIIEYIDAITFCSYVNIFVTMRAEARSAHDLILV
jgi:hypothetical protein